jgi:hypothetical protein
MMTLKHCGRRESVNCCSLCASVAKNGTGRKHGAIKPTDPTESDWLPSNVLPVSVNELLADTPTPDEPEPGAAQTDPVAGSHDEVTELFEESDEVIDKLSCTEPASPPKFDSLADPFLQAATGSRDSRNAPLI